MEHSVPAHPGSVCVSVCQTPLCLLDENVVAMSGWADSGGGLSIWLAARLAPGPGDSRPPALPKGTGDTRLQLQRLCTEAVPSASPLSQSPAVLPQGPGSRD